jgi:hypothetical protein
MVINPEIRSRESGILEDYVRIGNHLIYGNDLIKTASDVIIDLPKSPRIVCSPVNGKITEIRISKSFLHQFLYNGNPLPLCPYRVLHEQLLRDRTNPPSEAMQRGLYFESKCIGLTVGGGKTVDLPRHKKTGAKLTDHFRIDDAVDRFFYIVNELDMLVDSKYVQIFNERIWIDNDRLWDIKIIIEGTADFFSPISTPLYHHDAACIDLKLTKDRDACFPPFCWGCPDQIDKTEAMIYRLLFGLPFIYFVFDYRKDDPWYKDIPIITDINDPDPVKANTARLRTKDLWQNIRWTIGSIQMWEKQGWPMEPGSEACKRCPVRDCKKRNLTIEI